MEYTPVPEQPNSPQQLNRELTKVVDMLPHISTAEEDTLSDEAFGDMMGHRADSALLPKIDECVTTLIDQAPITTGCKAFIRETFALWYQVGIDPDYKEQLLADEFFFLDPTHPESGGVFNPDLAKKSDKFAFIKEIIHTRDAQKGLAKFVGDQSAQEKYEDKWKTIASWKEEFKQLHGEDITS